MHNKDKFRGVAQILVLSGFALALGLGLIIMIHEIDHGPITIDPTGKMQLLERSIWLVILEHLATALIILGVWHVFEQLFAKQEIKKEFNEAAENIRISSEKLANDKYSLFESKVQNLERLLKLADHNSKLGLEETFNEVESFNYGKFIRNSNSLTVVLADGYSWIGKNTEFFYDRFADKDKKTVIILVHPDSDVIPVISRKIGMKPEMYKERIFLSIKALNKIKAPECQLKILGHSLINCHSICIADKSVIYTPYYLSTQRMLPPIFLLKNEGGDSFASKLCKDVDFLIRESSQIDINE